MAVGARHPAFKQLLRVCRGSVAAHERPVVAEGLWALQLLLRLGTPIEQLFCCPELIHSHRARSCAAAAAERAASAYRLSAGSMHRVAERDAPEGLLAVVRVPRWSLDEVRIGERALIAVADGLENPGNLGTLLRTADGAGVDLVMITNGRARVSHPRVFRASHGMCLRVPHVELARAEDAIAWLREHGCAIHLAAPGGGVHYRQVDARGRTALVFGSERFGLSAAWAQQGFPRVAIPMLGAADSLNVAAAAAVLLYEARARKDDW